jgi:hypothetical protein
MADPLDTARAAGAAVAMATNAAILLASPDRYALWSSSTSGPTWPGCGSWTR